MDRIVISDLSVRCIIGVDEHERAEKQDVIINLTIYTDLHPAAQSDRFEDALDYRQLKKQVMETVEGSRYYLLEALAEAIAGVCLQHPKAMRVTVRVDKPSALRFARSVAVEIDREKPASSKE